MAKSKYQDPEESGGSESLKLYKVKIDNQLQYRLANEEVFRKRFEAATSDQYKHQQKLIELEYQERLRLAGNDLNARIAAEEEYKKSKLTLEQQYQGEIKKWRAKAEAEATNLMIQRYNKMNVYERQSYQEQSLLEQKKIKTKMEADAKEYDRMVKKFEIERQDQTKTAEQRAEAEKKYQEFLQKRKDKQDEIQNIVGSINYTEEQRGKLQQTILNAQLSVLDYKGKEQALQSAINAEEKRQQKIKEELVALEAEGKGKSKAAEELRDALKKSAEATVTLEDTLRDTQVEGAQQYSDDEVAKGAKDLIAQMKKDNAAKAKQLDIEKTARQDPEYQEAQKEAERLKAQEANQNFGPELLKNMKESLNAQKLAAKMMDDLAKSIDTNIDSFFEYQGTLEARLQGSEESYKDALKTVNKNVKFSGIVSQKEVVANIKTLVESGVAYNLELRAFLATTSENIAQTFDAFDSNLLRIIRIQQADTTASRLGMEASLTKLFNKYFQDTSYLTDAFDDVSGAILDASAQLTKENSIAFEYIVQKWLGSLYSVGLSKESVSTIAEGINYLATGNVEALNSNDSTRNLLAMSATKAGKDFGEILTEGLDADTTNLLLKSMVEYLQTIATNSDNNKVTKSVYGDVFGVNITDLKVLSNFTQKEIDQIFQQTQSYGDTMTELTTQLGQVASRIHLSQIVDTAIENIQASTANTIGNNIGVYGLWKTLNIIEGLTGGIHIPAFSVMGNMVDLSQFTIEGLGKTAIAGLSLMGNMLSGLFSGNLFGSLNLNSWGFDEYTKRGQGISALKTGVTQGVSQSEELSAVGNSSAEDMKASSMSDAAAGAEEDSKTVNSAVEDEMEEAQKMVDALYKDKDTTALTELMDIHQLLRNIDFGELLNVAVNVEERKGGFTVSLSSSPLGSGSGSGSESGTEVPITDLVALGDSIITQLTSLDGSAIPVKLINIDELSSKFQQTPLNITLPESSQEVLGSESSVVSGLGNLVTLLQNDDKVYNTNITGINLTGQGSTSSDVNNLVNSIISSSGTQSSQTANTITQLSNENSQLITNGNAAPITITGMSDEIKSFMATQLGNLITNSMVSIGETNDSNSQQDAFIEKLKSLLADLVYQVNVTDPYFDTVMQKLSFNN